MLQELVKRCEPLPAGSKVLILGAGFSGQHLGALLRTLGSQVICSRRQIEKPGADIVFDSENHLLPPKQAFEGVTHLISSIPPNANGNDPVLLNLNKQLQDSPLKWVGYLSTTGVYGDSEGKWLTEKDLTQPQQARSKRRLACEKAWQSSGLPVQILRLPGIYGPGRSAIESIKTGQIKMINKPGQVFSRIHIDDIAGAALHLIHLSSKGRHPLIVNVADDCPTANTDVLRYAANLIGSELPQEEPFAIASKNMSPMALSFWEENRRISNQLLCNELGYKLMHPNYRKGLKDCLLENPTLNVKNGKPISE